MSQEGSHQRSEAVANEGILPIPRLQEPISLRDTSMRDTPDVSEDINQRLTFQEPSSEEEEDEESSLEDTASSEDEEGEPKVRGLPVAELPTGLCYDERMRYHAEVSATTGENVHPEDPRRIYYIYKELCEAGLVADAHFKKSDLIVKTPLKKISAREATKEECCLVHTNNHYEFVKSTADMTDEDLIDLSEDIHMDSIYFNQLSYFSAKLSAGAAIDTCRAVVERQVKNAIAVIRPPGHHAEVQSTMGFCLFNNVCVASKVCQQQYGLVCRKILILDWDVHHGNGCQKAFYEDPNILYISLHVHMDGRFYPSGQDGAMDKVGFGRGLGKNVNIPWPTKGMGDGDYMYAFQQVVMPIAQEFDPDLVIVAAGFDAAAGDELGGCFVSPACYAQMTSMLMSLAQGKIAVCLEGGYNFAAISKSALAVTRTLMGEPPDRLQLTQATEDAVQTIEKVKRIQSQYWHNIFPKGPPPKPANTMPKEMLHDMIRQYQGMKLYEEHKLTELHILRDTISKSFQQQVIASRDYQDQRYLLVIFHDAPEVDYQGAQTSTVINLHDAVVSDAIPDYISTAIAHGFGVIDVNIPQAITLPRNLTDGLSSEEKREASQYIDEANPNFINIPYSNTLDLARQESARVARYLWENYIEPYDFAPESIIFMGCGHAFYAISRLMSELPNEAVYQSTMRERENAQGTGGANAFSGTTTGMLAGVVGFITSNPVRGVQNHANPWVTDWYKKSAMVFVDQEHQIFKKKVSRSYGNLVKVPGGMLAEMMSREEVQKQCWRFILEKVGAKVEKEDRTEEEEEMDERTKAEEKKAEKVRNAIAGAVKSEMLKAAGISEVPESDDVVMSTEK